MDMTALLDGQTGDTTQQADGTVEPNARQVGAFFTAGQNPNAQAHLSLMARGTFNGVTVGIDTAPTQSGPWHASTEAQFTAPGDKVTKTSSRAWIRPVVTGTGGTAPDVSLYVG